MSRQHLLVLFFFCFCCIHLYNINNSSLYFSSSHSTVFNFLSTIGKRAFKNRIRSLWCSKKFKFHLFVNLGCFFYCCFFASFPLFFFLFAFASNFVLIFFFTSYFHSSSLLLCRCRCICWYHHHGHSHDRMFFKCFQCLFSCKRFKYAYAISRRM